jgi:hypothetical protein
MLSIAMLLFLLILFTSIIPLKYPSGADTTMHAYIAKIISESPRFPTSYEPYLAINHFGQYPLGFPLLIAILHTTGIPIHISLSIVIIATYIFLYHNLFHLLTHLTSPLTGFIATIIILLTSTNIAFYVNWGGNPTILALAFLVLALEVYVRSFKRPSISSITIFSIIVASAIHVHLIPTVAFTIIASGLFIVTILFNWQKKVAASYLISMLLIFVFVLPRLISLQPISQETLEITRDWHNELGFLEYHQTERAITKLIHFISSHHKHFFPLLITSFILILISKESIRSKLSIIFYTSLSMGIIVLLIINSVSGFFHFPPYFIRIELPHSYSFHLLISLPAL